jgi:hypothetical protein
LGGAPPRKGGFVSTPLLGAVVVVVVMIVTVVGSYFGS